MDVSWTWNVFRLLWGLLPCAALPWLLSRLQRSSGSAAGCRTGISWVAGQCSAGSYAAAAAALCSAELQQAATWLAEGSGQSGLARILALAGPSLHVACVRTAFAMAAAAAGLYALDAGAAAEHSGGAKHGSRAGAAGSLRCASCCMLACSLQKDELMISCRYWAASWAGAAHVLGAPLLCLMGGQHAPVAVLGVLQAVSLCSLLAAGLVRSLCCCCEQLWPAC